MVDEKTPAMNLPSSSNDSNHQLFEGIRILDDQQMDSMNPFKDKRGEPVIDRTADLTDVLKRYDNILRALVLVLRRVKLGGAFNQPFTLFENEITEIDKHKKHHSSFFCLPCNTRHWLCK